MRSVKLDEKFPRYTEFDPKVPVWCVTPDHSGCIHRFFDTSPISPSGRYLAVFQLPFEHRQPKPGEKGNVCVVDLETGELRVIAETCGWEPQLGAHINWGGSDNELFYNDVDTSTWTAFAWKHDLIRGSRERMEGAVYHASTDGRWLVSANLLTMLRTQPGYGIRVPESEIPRNIGPADDDGFYLTDTHTGQCKLLVSIGDIVSKLGASLHMENPEHWEIYGFHAKFNPQGNRLMLSLRWFPVLKEAHLDMFSYDHSLVRFAWLTMDLDGKHMTCAVGPEEWTKGGHHATWFPDGKRISMNLNIDEDAMRFVQVNSDGTHLSKILSKSIGSGHPSIHPSGKRLITDVYNFEEMAWADGTIPIRWINLESEEEETIVRINTAQESGDIVMRVDPHPAWSRSWDQVVFNGYVGGTRRVFLADMRSLI